MTAPHERFMARCLELAQKGRGKTHPNPMVGAVIVDKTGEIVAEGFHEGYGKPHAEAMALQQAGIKAKGATIYVNLEPCNHHGKTPPCAEAVIEAGITKVVYGMSDPNPHVTGGGHKALQNKGIKVVQGLLESECQYLNEAFTHATLTKRPFIVVKQALTLDGRIATRQGESKWLTGPESRAFAHHLRSQSDAILSTATTVIKDNAQLTVRDADILGKPPVRIILDRGLSLEPENLTLFAKKAKDVPILVITSKGQENAAGLKALSNYGAEILFVKDTGNGLDLAELMDILGERRLTQILVEAGGQLTGSLLNAQFVQKLWLMYAPFMVLDPASKPAFSGNPLFKLQDKLPFNIHSTRQFGPDLALEVYP